jgi:hypothetical protein
MVGGPALMVFGLIYLTGASLMPFVAGLLGFTRRAVYIYTGILISLFVILAGWVFKGELKYQSAAQLVFRDIWMTGLLAAELLLAFVVFHWLGARLRAVFAWMIRRLRPRMEGRPLG